MGRPRKFYVNFYDDDRNPSVAEGLEAAKQASESYKAFATEQKAQEFSSWWVYRYGDHAAIAAATGK